MGRRAKPHYRSGHGHRGWYATVAGRKVCLISGDKEATRAEAHAIFERRVADAQDPRIEEIARRLTGRPDLIPDVMAVLDGSNRLDPAVPPAPSPDERVGSPAPIQAVGPAAVAAADDVALTAKMDELLAAFTAIDWRAVLLAAKDNTYDLGSHQIAIDYRRLADDDGPLALKRFSNPAARFDQAEFVVTYTHHLPGYGADIRTRWELTAYCLGDCLGVRHDGDECRTETGSIDSYIHSLEYLRCVYELAPVQPAGP